VRDATANLSLIETYYAAFNAADWEAMLACLHEDVSHQINQGGVEHGRAAFAAFLLRMRRCYRERLSDIVLFASPSHSDRYAAEYVVHGEYLASDDGLPDASGQRYILPGGAFFDVREGRISRVCNYYNVQDWLAQIAPSP
jgi:steroid delta-isomerase-like uncharacterized protein